VNLWLATGKEEYLSLLVQDAYTIVERFPASETPFLQERFYADWSPDKTWGWQQDHAVVGNNLKAAWNLMRVYHATGNENFRRMAETIAHRMPAVGMDKQRGGWYDTIERVLGPGEHTRRFLWNDRKAWWQQEQAILAYLILYGSLGKQEYLKVARESSAFYNAFCIDTESGAVLSNVLAGGEPYLLGNARLKGGHAMGAYHATELGYLATTYTNLLITKQPMTLYFCPQPSGFRDDILHVSPDLLPRGSIKIDGVWINDLAYTVFDAAGLTVRLPRARNDLRVKVTLAPADR
jgi:mannose/cellobiose epimerase-like protein (N-acyl-D-glucosamine 2-epimerase family)